MEDNTITLTKDEAEKIKNLIKLITSEHFQLETPFMTNEIKTIGNELNDLRYRIEKNK